MPTLKLDEKLVSAGAEASNEWVSASAETEVTTQVGASIKRGICLEAGIEALVNADAGLQQFIKLFAVGNAFAEAKASVQLQLTLNAFDALGFSLGAQAKAQAAAGIGVRFGIIVGDFIRIIEEISDIDGLPLDLIFILLEEFSIEAEVRAHVAASAAAYAEIKGTLRLVQKQGQKPGFFFRAKAGVGLAAGAGFAASFGCGFKDPGRCYGRIIDKLVNAIVEQVEVHLSSSDQNIRDIGFALRPIAKLTLRHAFELGHYIAENASGNVASSPQELAARTIRVIVEESRQFFFELMIRQATDTINDFLLNSGIRQDLWDSAKDQRHDLTAALRTVSDEPFYFSNDNITVWTDIVDSCLSLLEKLQALQAQDKEKLLNGLTLFYVTSQLLLKTNQARVERATAYAQAIGAGTASVPPPELTGAVQPPAPNGVRKHINKRLNLPEANPITYEVLISFLSGDLVIDPLRNAFPQLDTFLTIFSGPLATAENEIFRRLISMPSGANANSIDLFELLVGVLSDFIDNKLLVDFAEEVSRKVSDPTINLYLNEVIFPTLNYTSKLTFSKILTWRDNPPNRDDFLEVLSSIAVMPLSRSSVIMFDALLTAVQGCIKDAFDHAAISLENPNGPFRILGIERNGINIALFKGVLGSLGTILGPFDGETRSRLRHKMFDVLSLPPAGNPDDFLNQLSADFFIPNLVAMNSLKDEFLSISADRFGKFILALMDSAVNSIEDLVEEVFKQAVELINEWLDDLNAALDDLAKEIGKLLKDIEKALHDLQVAFQKMVDEFEELCNTISGIATRSRVHGAFADEVSNLAIEVLRQNDLYKVLPREIKSLARTAVRGAVDLAVQSPLIDPIFSIIGGIFGVMETLIEDIKHVNPNQPLANQIKTLILDKIDLAVVEYFGSSDPQLSIGFDFYYDFFGPQHIHFNLGSFTIPIHEFCNILRGTLDGFSLIQTQAEALAAELTTAFKKQIEHDNYQSDKEEAVALQQKKQQLKSDHAVSQKSIAIISPQSKGVYDHSVNVCIHFGGVPKSYLGLDAGEEAHVFILLNGAQLSLKSIVVQEDIHNLTAKNLLNDYGGVNFRNLHISTSSQATNAIKPNYFVTNRTLGSNAISSRLKNTASLAPHTITPQITKLLPGRKGSVSIINNWRGEANQQAPGLTISFELFDKDLAPGINVLSILVVEPDKSRYQQNVSFVFLPDSVPSKPKGGKGIKIPTLPGGRIPNKNDKQTFKNSVDWMNNNAQLQTKLKQNKEYNRMQSSLNFKKK